jgi:uncharacterized repeat protein (TIGR01451 family)
MWPLLAGVSVLITALLVGDVVSLVRADSVAAAAQIALDASASRGALDPGTTATYTISVRNRGGADAVDLRLVDPLPAGIDSARWTCTADGGARCARASGSGDIDEAIALLPAGGSLVYTVEASVARHPPAYVKNAMRVELPAGVTCADKQPSPCRAQLDLAAAARVAVASSASVAAPTPGQPFVYTLTVHNPGSIDAAGTVVRDPMPFGLAQFDWMCAGSAPCPRASGSGSLHETLVSFPAGSALTYTIHARLGANPPARVTHTATANPPYGGSCGDGTGIHAPPCVATTISPANSAICGTAGATACAPMSALIPAAAGTAEISIYISDLNGSALPGDTVTYVLNVNNTSVDTAADRTVLTDPLPAGITSFTWTCIANAGSVGCPNSGGAGPLAETLNSFPPGSGFQYSISALVAQTPPAYITNIATATPPANVPTVCYDGSAPPCSAQDRLPTVPVIDVTKFTVGGSDAPPGSTVTYNLDLSNFGTPISGVLGISDPVPAGLVNVTWTCVVSSADQPPGACPNASGSGDINEVVTALNHNDKLVYTIVATVDVQPPLGITNIATVTPPSGSLCNVGSPPCVAQTTVFTRPSVGVTKTSATQQLVPGGVATYTVTVDSLGTNAGGTHLGDPVPAGIDRIDWTCQPVGGFPCPNASGTGALDETIASFYNGTGLVYSLTATVSQTATGSVTNIATVTPPAGGDCGPSGCAATLTLRVAVVPTANLLVTKTADVTVANPGQAVVYTVTLVNNGSAAATNTTLADPIPAGIANFAWTCTSSTSECPNPAGSGAIDELIPMLTGQVQYTVTAVVDTAPPATITNIATITPANGATCNQSVCTATSPIATQIPGAARINVFKTADVSALSAAGRVVYTVTVSNNGGTDSDVIAVLDPIPSGLTAFTWTCTANGAGGCPAASGQGALNERLPTLPAGSALSYRIVATVDANPPSSVTNTAAAVPSNPADCSATRCTASVTLPLARPNVVVTNTVEIPGGGSVQAGQPIRWILTVTNDGAPTSAAVTLTDVLPAAIQDITVSADPGVQCSPAQPAPGQTLVCTIAPGFTGSLRVTINATIAVDTTGDLNNSVTATGPDAPTCSACSVSSPVAAATDVALANPRAFVAAGINGTLFDVVNRRVAVPVTVTVEPAADVLLLGSYAAACTASIDDGAIVVVACPTPPAAQNVNCTGATCSIAALPQGVTLTVFVAANGSASLTVHASAAGDANPDDNTLVIAGSAGTP